MIEAPQEWSPPYWDDEHAAYAGKLLLAADALLLGRATYEAFAQAWPSRSGDEYSDRINAMPKHVASRSLTETGWNATVLEGELAAEVAALKEQPGADLLKFGSGEVDRTLVAHGLLDELHLWIFPVIAGRGQRLVEGIGTTHLELVDTTRFASGIVVNVYSPN